jgi:chromosome segregation ATPase
MEDERDQLEKENMRMLREINIFSGHMEKQQKEIMELKSKLAFEKDIDNFKKEIQKLKDENAYLKEINAIHKSDNVVLCERIKELESEIREEAEKREQDVYEEEYSADSWGNGCETCSLGVGSHCGFCSHSR